MCSSHDITRRELPRARGRRVSAIAWEAPGTISDWNATCHRRCRSTPDSADSPDAQKIPPRHLGSLIPREG
jgi:hypothetical protein